VAVVQEFLKIARSGNLRGVIHIDGALARRHEGAASVGVIQA
jgi:hypothetical protein